MKNDLKRTRRIWKSKAENYFQDSYNDISKYGKVMKQETVKLTDNSNGRR